MRSLLLLALFALAVVAAAAGAVGSVRALKKDSVLQPQREASAPATAATSGAELLALVDAPFPHISGVAESIRSAKAEAASATHQSLLQAQAETRTAAYPGTAIGTEPNYAAARTGMRYGVGADPGAAGFCVDQPNANAALSLTAAYYQPGPFATTYETPVCYMLLPNGRVKHAIVQQAIVGPKTNPSPFAQEYCDVLFDPLQSTGAWGVATGRNALIPNSYGMKYSRAWQAGHIIAASLGGTNMDPINFFPQHFSVNTGTDWQALENIARHLTKAKLSGMAMAIPVALTVSFDYAGVQLPLGVAAGSNLATPSGGTYRVSIPLAAHAALCETVLKGYGLWMKAKPPSPYAQKKGPGGYLYRPKHLVTQSKPTVTVKGAHSGVLSGFCIRGALDGTGANFVLSIAFTNVIAP